MKKDKEVKEERSVYSTDSYLTGLSIYLWQSGGFQYRDCSKCECQRHNLFYVDNTAHVTASPGVAVLRAIPVLSLTKPVV